MEQIIISATVNAPIARVWEHWNNPASIMQWNHASDDWECPSAAVDLRVGGTFTSTMAAKDGSASFEFGGIYDAVVPSERIAYHMEPAVFEGKEIPKRDVLVTFTEMADGVQVTIAFDPENIYDREQQRAGWQAILDNFKTFVETQEKD